MGEETKNEETKVEEKKEEKTEEKKEEKTEEKQEEKTEEKKEEKTEEKPPLPFVLLVDLHCVGCAKKIEKSLLRIRGVEGVVIEMMKNEVTIKGVVEPQAICDKIMKITKRKAKVLSPLPAADGESIPQILASQVSGTNTVELNVNMHCEACALQLKRKILKMKGVRTVETELSSGKVTVTGTMDPNKLVDYVYRRTKKQAKIVPQPDPEPAQETKPEEEKKEEPKPEEEKKEEPKPEEEKKEESAEEKKDENAPGEEKKGDEESKEEEGAKKEINVIYEENSMQRMMYNYQPLYHVFERMPPPQLFSDENPNACCIS